MNAGSCELCTTDGGVLLWSDERCRVIRVDEKDYPGYCRVIWRTHVAEMTDLTPDDRAHLMAVVFEVEAALRAVTKSDKINLASFGNMVPHLHWHLIPRWREDACFPLPVWGARQREGRVPAIDQAALAENICKRLAVLRRTDAEQER